MSKFTFPAEALDDRLAVTGTAGSGKTYGAGVLVEKLLHTKARVVIPDPLGVWHGLRLGTDGKSPGFPVVIFGGEHGDLPLTESAGALIGETVAGMAESVILDLTGLGTKAAERRFMLAFLTALYRKTNREPVHVVFDEADMWAPQNVSDKDGGSIQLLGMMETICRRGRIKGFVPWLITQRPAVLNKNVLSQADGLIAFKLTSPQDRKALGDWVSDQAEPGEGYDILFRMLEPEELAAAMGFTTEDQAYEFAGTKTEKIKQIGNAVSVSKMKACVGAIMADAAPKTVEKPKASRREAA